MSRIELPGATSAPSPKTLQTARVEAAGVSPSLAVALADLWFAGTKRDDCSLLASVTANRIGASTIEMR